MALQIRRGTDAERQAVTFAEGELIYTTDTKLLYVGDGTTAGGILASSGVGSQLTTNLDLNDQEINGVGSIDITGSIAADVINGGLFVGDGSGLTNLPGGGIAEGSNYRINIIGDDSTTIVNSSSNAINAVSGSFENINAVSGSFENIIAKTDILSVIPNDDLNTSSHQIRVISNENQSTLKLTRQSETDLSPADIIYGSIFFERLDLNGGATSGLIIGMSNKIIIGSTSTGTFGEENLVTLLSNGMFGIGTSVPNQTLDVRGNGAFEGTVTAASFNGSVVADDSTTIVDAINGTISASGYIQFGSYTTIERDAIGASNGMVIYNSTTNRFQGYQNGAWINLDDGTAG
jgi:hypothetical protein